MGKTARVDQIPMLHDSDSAVSRGVELSRMESPPEFNVNIREDEDVVGELYGTSGASVASKGRDEFGKHEHLLKSGPMGRCDDPFCSTCPSYFGYSEEIPAHLRPPQPTNVLGRANVLSRKAASWSRTWIPGILNPHTKRVQQWNKFFCISSLIAIFVDPVFFLLLAVKKDDKCLVFNNAAAVAVTVVRTMTDSIHIMHICLQFRLAYVAPASKIRGAGELEDDPKKVAIHYIQGWFFLDLFTALPLPQLLIWTVVKKMLGKASGANYAKDVLRVVVLVQNVPRSLRFFPLLTGRSPSGFVFENAWSNFVINLLMYLLAGHIVGSCWYLFGLQRVNQCLENQCDIEHLGVASVYSGISENFFCQRSYLDCGAGDAPQLTSQSYNSRDDDPAYMFWKNSTMVGQICLEPTTASYAGPQFYGIYLAGVPVVTEKKTINKYIYALFWGFQQLSTLAGNLIPSIFAWEVLFTMGIVGLGLLLFALLIGNMQNFLQALGRRKLEMQLKRYDTEDWMKKRRLPTSLRRRVRNAVRFKWSATGGVEERDLVADLPEDLQKDIQRYLCLELVKKVRLFELLEDHVLDAICERLYQKLYIEGSEIFRAKQPVERMLFIVRGKLESRGEDGSVVPLKEGDFCGEELLLWCIDMLGVSTSKWIGTKKHRGKHPPSSRTVKCLQKVEAFSLDAVDLEYITTHYKAAFKSPRVHGMIRYLSPYWRTIAATRIQKAWRSCQDKRSTRPPPTRTRRFTRFGTMNNRIQF